MRFNSSFFKFRTLFRIFGFIASGAFVLGASASNDAGRPPVDTKVLEALKAEARKIQDTIAPENFQSDRVLRDLYLNYITGESDKAKDSTQLASWLSDAEWFGSPPLSIDAVRMYFPDSYGVCSIDFQDVQTGKTLESKQFHWSLMLTREGMKLFPDRIVRKSFNQSGEEIDFNRSVEYIPSGDPMVYWFLAPASTMILGEGTRFARVWSANEFIYGSSAAHNLIRINESASAPFGPTVINNRYSFHDGILESSRDYDMDGVMDRRSVYVHGFVGVFPRLRRIETDLSGDGGYDFLSLVDYEFPGQGLTLVHRKNYYPGIAAPENLVYTETKEYTDFVGLTRKTSVINPGSSSQAEYDFYLSYGGLGKGLWQIDVHVGGEPRFRWIYDTTTCFSQFEPSLVKGPFPWSKSSKTELQ